MVDVPTGGQPITGADAKGAPLSSVTLSAPGTDMPQLDYRQFQQEVESHLKSWVASDHPPASRRSVRRELWGGAVAKAKATIGTELIVIPRDLPVLEVEDALANSVLKEHLCPVLRSLTGDIFEYSKVVTPVVVALALAGTIAVPIAPAVVAGIVLFIARAGVESYCSEGR